MRLRAVALLLLSVSLSATRAGAAVARSGQVVMGTVLTVTVVAADSTSAESMSKAAIDEARRWDDALTIWRPDGELAKLNARAGQGPVDVSERLADGLSAMLRLAQATGGAFDPAVGRLPASGDPRGGLRGVRAVLDLQGRRAALEAGTVLDPGAIGKGLALDAIAVLLRRAGATAAFLDFGGSSQTAFGTPPGDDEGWSVLVAGLAEGSSHGLLKLRDASLSTSRAGAGDTKPILDPRSGVPVPAPRLVTVRAPDATAADAWSTALVVLGREGLPAALAAGVEVLGEDGQGTVTTPGFGPLGRVGEAGK